MCRIIIPDIIPNYKVIFLHPEEIEDLFEETNDSSSHINSESTISDVESLLDEVLEVLDNDVSSIHSESTFPSVESLVDEMLQIMDDDVSKISYDESIFSDFSDSGEDDYDETDDEPTYISYNDDIFSDLEVSSDICTDEERYSYKVVPTDNNFDDFVSNVEYTIEISTTP